MFPNKYMTVLNLKFRLMNIVRISKFNLFRYCLPVPFATTCCGKGGRERIEDLNFILNILIDKKQVPILFRNIWEDVEHGLIYGSEDFVTDIRSRFLSEDKNPELPQHNQIAKTISTRELLNNSAAKLNFDLKAAATEKRVTSKDKDKRDLLICLFRESGRLTNKEIGSYFGLTYSSVSRRVEKTRKRLPQETEFNNTFEKLKSLIKV